MYKRALFLYRPLPLFNDVIGLVSQPPPLHVWEPKVSLAWEPFFFTQVMAAAAGETLASPPSQPVNYKNIFYNELVPLTGAGRTGR